jgi:hypothetical protein
MGHTAGQSKWPSTISALLSETQAGLILPFVDVVSENVVQKFANDILVRSSWFSGVTSPVIPDVGNFCQIIFGIITWFDVKVSHEFDDEFIRLSDLKVVRAGLAMVNLYIFAFKSVGMTKHKLCYDVNTRQVKFVGMESHT